MKNAIIDVLSDLVKEIEAKEIYPSGERAVAYDLGIDVCKGIIIKKIEHIEKETNA